MTGLSDSFQRPINYLRISVTDRCNMRCVYCTPAEGIELFHRDEILTFEEVLRIVEAASSLGISKVRLSGGEPLVRSGLADFIAKLSRIQGIDDVSLTTNGLLLKENAAKLKEAGLRRVNVSLDSLRKDRFRAITRGGDLSKVLDGLEEAGRTGLHPVKINTVVMRGVNDDEIVDFCLRSKDGWNVRFIELMPMTRDEGKDKLITIAEIQKIIEKRMGKLQPGPKIVGNGPAKYFRLENASGTIGFISPVSEHFCFGCNRLRLTAHGKLCPCLLGEEEIDLRNPLRNGITDEALKEIIKEAARSKPERHHLDCGIVAGVRCMSQIGG